MKVEYFESINLTPPKDRIYSRLGYAKNVTLLTEKQKEEVEKYIDDALAAIELKGAACYISITDIEGSVVKLSENIEFNSASLAELFRDCQAVFFVAATAGGEIVKFIQKDSLGKDITSAVIFDAVASETVDASLGWIMSYFERILRRENKTFTNRRFSAGYGDFSLENQKIIHEVLDLNKIGITLDEKYILFPEKSVTAVAGIKTFL